MTSHLAGPCEAAHPRGRQSLQWTHKVLDTTLGSRCDRNLHLDARNGGQPLPGQRYTRGTKYSPHPGTPTICGKLMFNLQSEHRGARPRHRLLCIYMKWLNFTFCQIRFTNNLIVWSVDSRCFKASAARLQGTGECMNPPARTLRKEKQIAEVGPVQRPVVSLPPRSEK